MELRFRLIIVLLIAVLVRKATCDTATSTVTSKLTVTNNSLAIIDEDDDDDEEDEEDEDDDGSEIDDDGRLYKFKNPRNSPSALCPRNEEQATLFGQKCLRKCSSHDDCKSKKKKCLCDGLCGMSCIKPDRECPKLPDLELGTVTITGRFFADKATYTCHHGYHVVGLSTRTCQADGSWSGNSPSCKQNIYCLLPPTIENARHNAIPEQSTFDLDSTIQYFCNVGYETNGFPRAKCLAIDGKASWYGPDISCEPKSCGTPLEISHGWHSGDCYTYGCKIQYQCSEGFELVGKKEVYCEADGSWSPKDLPTCVLVTAVQCPSPDNPRNGKAIYTSCSYNSVVSYECKYGFTLVGDSTRRCGADKKWSGTTPVCKEINCGHPGRLWNGWLENIEGGTGLGASIIFRCHEGMKLEGHSSTVCQIDGKWRYALPNCSAPCVVPHVEQGSVYLTVHENDTDDQTPQIFHQTVVPHGTELGVDCKAKFEFLSNQTPVTCRNGTWSIIPRCEPARCKRMPKPPKNGMVIAPKTDHGMRALFKCKDGYALIGNRSHVQCFYGNWTGDVPSCEEVFCPFPGFIENGKVLLVGNMGLYDYRPYVRKVQNNKQIMYECDKGFIPAVGPPGATCIGGRWSPIELPKCVPGKHPRIRWNKRRRRSIATDNLRQLRRIYAFVHHLTLKQKRLIKQRLLKRTVNKTYIKHRNVQVKLSNVKDGGSHGKLCVTMETIHAFCVKHNVDPMQCIRKRVRANTENDCDGVRGDGKSSGGDAEIRRGNDLTEIPFKRRLLSFDKDWEEDTNEEEENDEYEDDDVNGPGEYDDDGKENDVNYKALHDKIYYKYNVKHKKQKRQSDLTEMTMNRTEINHVKAQNGLIANLRDRGSTLREFIASILHIGKKPHTKRALLSKHSAHTSHMINRNGGHNSNQSVRRGDRNRNTVSKIPRPDKPEKHANGTRIRRPKGPCDYLIEDEHTEIEIVKYGRDPNNTYSSGTVVRVTCAKGYDSSLPENTTAKCIRGLWKPARPQCGITPCFVPNVPNGFFKIMITPENVGVVNEEILNETLEINTGEAVKFYCNKGFKIKGVTNLNCWHGKWDVTVMPDCTPAPCQLPAIYNGQYLNGYRAGLTIGNGSFVTYQCDTFYRKATIHPIQCILGELFPKNPACRLSRPPGMLPQLLKNLTDRIEFRAGSDISQNGGLDIIDKFNMKACGRPAHVPGTVLYMNNEQILPDNEQNLYQEGTQLTYACASNQLEEKISWRILCEDGSWTGRSLDCEEEAQHIKASQMLSMNASCTYRNNEPNVMTFYNDHEIREDVVEFPPGVVLTSRCVDIGKYAMIGSPYRKCIGPDWDTEKSVCFGLNQDNDYAMDKPPTILFRHSQGPIAQSNDGKLIVYPGTVLHMECLWMRRFGFPKWNVSHSYRKYPEGWTTEEGRDSTLEYRISVISATKDDSGVYTCVTPARHSHSVEIDVRVVHCPDVPMRRGLTVSSRETKMNSRLLLSCENSNALIGASEITCLPSGNWSHPFPTCESVECGEVFTSNYVNNRTFYDDINSNHLRVIIVSRDVGGRAIFSCTPGYGLRGPSETVCLSSGEWALPYPTCVEVQCDQPGVPDNGYVQGTAPYKAGDIVQFNCKPDYMMEGQPIIVCQDNSRWSGPVPKCVQACSYPGTTISGRMSAVKFFYKIGETITFSCDEGLILRGAPMIRCLKNGKWSNAIPTCLNTTTATNLIDKDDEYPKRLGKVH